MKNPKQPSKRGRKPKESSAPETITLLSNSAHYFLESVFIVVYPDCCRLVVYLKGKRLTDKSYDSMKGARIAFARIYRDNAFSNDVFPEWTHYYNPQRIGLQERWTAERDLEPGYFV